jgi:hypothetical protein
MNLPMTMRRACAALLLACSAAAAAPSVPAMSQPPIRHVFVIVLENKGFVETFGPDSPAPYFSKTLTRQGVLLTQYFGTAHYSLGNYLAMISGQGGTPETRDDCETFADFVGIGTTADGQAIGHGCVYPASVQTLPEQLEALHKSWGGYMEDLGNDPARESATCGQPPLNGADPTQHAEAPSAAVPKGDQYAARHNPFVYFHSLTDGPACRDHVVNLERLATDLAQVATTPEFVFISPNLCHDGHDAPCKNGEPGGLKSADAFLKTWVPRIMASPAYKRDGLLIVTFDEGDADEVKLPDGRIKMEFEGESCCNQQPGPNLGAFPQTQSDAGYLVTLRSFGGDRTGTVLLSPFLAPGTVSATPFNHYSLLKSLEDIYGVGTHLGYAGQPGLVGLFDPGSDLRRRAPIKFR